MSRGVGYRVWHKKYKKMYQVKGVIQGDDSCGGWQALCIYCIDEEGVTERFSDGLAELMEEVPFSDKNGRHVYEGDIIKAIVSDRNGEEVREIIEDVRYDKGLLCPFYMRVNFEEDWWKNSLVDGFEVVGNIYEHLNLLG